MTSLKDVRDRLNRTINSREAILLPPRAGELRMQVAWAVRELDRIMKMPQHNPDQLSLIEPDPATRNSDPITSHQAAATLMRKPHKLSRMRRSVLHLLFVHGPLSDPELRHEYEKKYQEHRAESTVRKRRGECYDMGWVKATGDFYTFNGQKYTMWDLTDRGLAALDEEE